MGTSPAYRSSTPPKGRPVIGRRYLGLLVASQGDGDFAISLDLVKRRVHRRVGGPCVMNDYGECFLQISAWRMSARGDLAAVLETDYLGHPATAVLASRPEALEPGESGRQLDIAIDPEEAATDSGVPKSSIGVIPASSLRVTGRTVRWTNNGLARSASF